MSSGGGIHYPAPLSSTATICLRKCFFVSVVTTGSTTAHRMHRRAAMPPAEAGGIYARLKQGLSGIITLLEGMGKCEWPNHSVASLSSRDIVVPIIGKIQSRRGRLLNLDQRCVKLRNTFVNSSIEFSRRRRYDELGSTRDG